MTTRRSARKRTQSTAVIVASILLIIGLVAWIAVARNTAAPADFEGAGNGHEEIVEIPEGTTLTALGPTLEERRPPPSRSWGTLISACRICPRFTRETLRELGLGGSRCERSWEGTEGSLLLRWW